MSNRQLFGTDGVRGVAGRAPMTATFALALGVATAEHLRERGTDRPVVVVGRDTRRSGPMLASAVTAGLTAGGADVVDLGVMPTAGVSFLVRALEAAAGVVVSASHNPYDDNGLKLFGADGAKLADAEEASLEERLDDHGDTFPEHVGMALDSIRRYRHEDGQYLRFLLGNAPYLDGLRVALDCANGAAYQIAPRVFKQIGARLDVAYDKPDGANINAECGSMHPEAIRARVKRGGLDVGITFDGDADRALLVDRKGRLVTGDHVLAICSVVRGEQHVVATEMTNLGVERYMAAEGVTLHRVAVGDRYVHEKLLAEGWRLGGEQSGHVLFLDKAPTGDGILTALQTLAACRASGVPLEAWLDRIPVYPQSLLNVRVPANAKSAIVAESEVAAAVAEAVDALGDDGRVNLRPSGTEPVVRVMVEAATDEAVEHWSNHVAAAVRRAASRHNGVSESAAAPTVTKPATTLESGSPAAAGDARVGG
jgi:phosphoglucosamine mutase